MMAAIAKELGDVGRAAELEVRFLEPDEYWRLEEMFGEEKAAMPDPSFSKVLVALDGEKIAGIIVAQMALHIEPIIILPEYRNGGVWRQMAEMMDGYLSTTGIAGAYAQPVHESTKHMCEMTGFKEMEHSLWLKIYNPDLLKSFPEGGV